MGDLSDYEASRLGNASLRNTAYTPAATVYVALSANGTDELALGGYSRQSVVFDAFGGTSASQNSGVVTFGPATVDWGTPSYARLCDASAAGNGISDWKALTDPQPVGVWDSLSFAVGDIDWTY